MRTKSGLIVKFVRPMLKSLVIIVAGFFLAPSHLLISLYEKHDGFRNIAVILSFLVVVVALFNMISISLKAISLSDEKPES